MTAPNAMTVFRAELEQKMAPQFAAVLPDHLTIERLIRTIANAVSLAQKPNGRNALLEADRTSLWNACMTSAVLGLEPDPAMGQGYIIPFKGKCVFIPGYKGLITLAFNSGFVVDGRIVRQKDEKFEYGYGLQPFLHHKPGRSHERGKDNPIVAAYAVARHSKVEPAFIVMEMPDIIRVMERSSGYQYAKKNNMDNPWISDFEAMARKSPIRRLADSLPLNVQKAAALDAILDSGKVAYAKKRSDGTIDITEETVEDDTAQGEATVGEVTLGSELPDTMTTDEWMKAGQPDGYRLEFPPEGGDQYYAKIKD